MNQRFNEIVVSQSTEFKNRKSTQIIEERFFIDDQFLKETIEVSKYQFQMNDRTFLTDIIERKFYSPQKLQEMLD